MYNYIRTYTATLVLAGTAAGTVQVGNTIDPTVTPSSSGGVVLNGQLMAVQLQFTPTMTGAVTTIATMDAPTQTLLSYTGGTSQWFVPRFQATGNGTALISGVYDRWPLDDMVTVSVSGGSAGTLIAKFKVFQGA